MKVCDLKKLILETIRSSMVEDHETAKLEVMISPQYRFCFFLNGAPAGVIMRFDPQDGYLAGMAVLPSLRKTGLGKAMINFLFQKYPNVQEIRLHSWHKAYKFYDKIGGRSTPDQKIEPDRGYAEYKIRKNQLKPSSLSFHEIPYNKRVVSEFPGYMDFMSSK